MDAADRILALLAVDPRALPVGALVGARLAPLLWLAPWLGGRALPVVVRGPLLLALTVALTPHALRAAPAALPAPLAPALVAEAVRGVVYAFALALPFHAAEWAGRLADLWRGAQGAALVEPDTGETTGPLGLFYRAGTVALFVGLGGHLAAFEGLVDGLATVPPGSALRADSVAAVALGAARLAADALGLAVAVAAPAAVAVVLSEVALGLLARAAPQIPMYFAGLPLRAAAGLAALALAAAVAWPRIADALAGALARAPTP